MPSRQGSEAPPTWASTRRGGQLLVDTRVRLLVRKQQGLNQIRAPRRGPADRYGLLLAPCRTPLSKASDEKVQTADGLLTDKRLRKPNRILGEEWIHFFVPACTDSGSAHVLLYSLLREQGRGGSMYQYELIALELSFLSVLRLPLALFFFSPQFPFSNPTSTAPAANTPPPLPRFQKLRGSAMRPAVLAALLFLAAAAASPAAALYSAGPPVLQLNPNNFKSKVLEANGVVLVEFFAPWCGHCKQLAPAWEKAAGVLKGVARVAALDADAHQALAQEYGIKGFPTIKVFVPGKPPVDYQGARDVKPIVEFALSQVKSLLRDRLNGKASGGSSGKTSGGSSEKNEPSASVELNSRNFDELVVKSKDLWIVEFFAPWCGHCKKLAPEWKRAAKNLKGRVKLGHVDCDAEKSLMSKYKVEGFPTILVFGADKESPFPHQGPRVASAIESFALEQLEANSGPAEVSELTGPDVMEEKCASAAICFVSFLPDILDSKAEGRNKYLELLLSVAEKFKKSPYSFVWTAAGKQADLENQVGVGGYGYPAMVALNVKKGAYAPLRSAFQHDEIIEFVKEAGRGGKGNLPLNGSPTVVASEPWDGKDGEEIVEDEFSLDELMGESSPVNDEL